MSGCADKLMKLAKMTCKLNICMILMQVTIDA